MTSKLHRTDSPFHTILAASFQSMCCTNKDAAWPSESPHRSSQTLGKGWLEKNIRALL